MEPIIVDDQARSVVVRDRGADDIGDDHVEQFRRLKLAVALDDDRETLAEAAGGNGLARQRLGLVVAGRRRAAVGRGDVVRHRTTGGSAEADDERQLLRPAVPFADLEVADGQRGDAAPEVIVGDRA